MGYTHYFEFFDAPKDLQENIEHKYQKALNECSKIVKAVYQGKTSFGKIPLSGFTAHAPIGKYGGLHVNGKGDNGHEDFILRESFDLNGGFGFCKTAQKPYDLIVVACLTVLKHYLGHSIAVSSDGRVFEWVDGVELAREVLKNDKIENPLARNRFLKGKEA